MALAGQGSQDAGGGESRLPGDRRFGALGVVISVIALAGVVIWASGQEAPTLPSSPGEIGALAAAVAVYAAATALRGERWWWLLRDSSVDARRSDAYGLTVVGFMGNNVLPARGGDAMRVVFLNRRTDGSARTIIGTLLTERLLDVVVLLGLFVILGYGLLRGIETPDTGTLILVIAVVAVVTAIAAAALWTNRDRPRVRRVWKQVAPMLAPTRRLRGSHAAVMLGQTIGIWMLEALTYLTVAGSVGIELSYLEASYLVAVASIFVLIPSGPGYAGTLDAAILFGLGAVGVEGGTAVSYLLMARFVLLIPITFAGLAILLARYRKSSA